MSWGLFSERLFSLANKNTPESIGPGKYDTMPHIGNDKSMKVPFNNGAPPPKDPYAKNPGPGAYEPKKVEYGNKNYSSVFDSKTKRKAYTENTIRNPSPTAYSHLDSWMPEPPAIPKKDLPRYKIPSGFVGQNVTGYIENETGEMVPVKKPFHDQTYLGPGYYDPELPSKENPPVSLEMSANRDLYGIPPDVPGPGAYHPIHRDTRIPTVIAERPKEKVVYTNRPMYTGPRVWTSLANETNACFKTRGTRHIFPPGDPTPDPTAYDMTLPQSKKHGDLSSFGVKSDRPPIHNPDDNPGPGTYNVKGPKWVKKGKPTTAKAIHKDVIPTAYVPGPGAYDPVPTPKKRPDNRPNSVFSSKTARTYSSETLPPGPGKYTPYMKPLLKEDPKNKKLHFTDVQKHQPPNIEESRFPAFGNWFASIKKDLPGPDQYQHIESDLSKGRTIPLSPRFEITHKNRDPGPGAYDITHKTMLRHSFNSSIPNY
ncbi:hypothetical protein TRFO_33865 [Tritrichomonas foetus]|uniref:Uncharacterized protein n=1 Tax=Tritrichomonas foetus TaxID=1144522 RepID=A0A1J4JMH1_9EUKA|nr:hypothetical protein TRFO_33865 [Tritrichomonas foetus]|eukprot:OHS99631.1 hypothetical protein TRFO_33865 [Tritrichomonas foetus]